MANLHFRPHPEQMPSGRVSVFGPSMAAAEKMSAYAARRNPGAPRAAGIYLEMGGRFGIRGDVAFCQAMLDTKVWTEAPAGPSCMPMAGRIWGYDPAAWQDTGLVSSVERHFQQLLAFAERREGSEFGWEDLNGCWAVPGTRYGQDILAIWRNMMDWRSAGTPEEESGKPAARPAAGAAAHTPQEAGKGEEALAWLSERGWTPSPVPHTERKVTWAELALVLKEWENGA